jgi:hypothetical protein
MFCLQRLIIYNNEWNRCGCSPYGMCSCIIQKINQGVSPSKVHDASLSNGSKSSITCDRNELGNFTDDKDSTIC